jgi:aspartate/methionine/tyrosine aminotransferase
MRHPGFPYMTWAKGHYWGTSLSLVPSGMAPPPREMLDLPQGLDPLAEIVTEGPDTIQEDLARAYSAELPNLIVQSGSTQADLLSFTSFVHAGDRVLIEQPAYGLFESLAATRGAPVDRFVRRAEQAWALDLDTVRAALQPGTRLIVLTTVHNPTGSLASEDELHALGELCDEHDCLALCSEVYLDFVAGAGSPGGRRYAWQIHPRLLSANSFTKVYGLGSLRLGWLMGTADLIAEARNVREAIAPVLPALPVHLARETLRHKDALLRRARERAESGRAIFAEWLQSEEGFDAVLPQTGLVAALRLEGVRDTMGFAAWLREAFDLGVVPGDFFSLPGYLRVGYGVEEPQLRSALDALARGRRAWIETRGADA